MTGSAGHLGEALVRTLRSSGARAIGLDVLESPYTDVVGSIGDRELVRRCLQGVSAVAHCATLHKPHVATHAEQAFVDTNIAGTLSLLQEARAAGVEAFVFTSTTSAFGSALTPGPGAPAAWITEAVPPVPRNIYGVTKVAAENLCELYARRHRLPVIILRTSRFFPEADDDAEVRRLYGLDNAQANEMLYRRVDLADVVSAHLCAFERAQEIGFGRYIVSATTPFRPGDADALAQDATPVVARLYPVFEQLYGKRGWRMTPQLDRVYDNRLARRELGWKPQYDFAHVLASLEANKDFRSPLARAVGSKGYHSETFDDGPYPVN